MRRAFFDLYTILIFSLTHPEVTRVRFLVTLRCFGSTERMKRPHFVVAAALQSEDAAAAAYLLSHGISADGSLITTSSLMSGL
jgi:hypothetical protein